LLPATQHQSKLIGRLRVYKKEGKTERKPGQTAGIMLGLDGNSAPITKVTGGGNAREVMVSNEATH
jgi:hypothetical protein